MTVLAAPSLLASSDFKDNDPANVLLPEVTVGAGTVLGFRCGSMYRSPRRYSVKQFDAVFDEVAPAGRVLRQDCIYVSPTRAGLDAWIPIKERRREQRSVHPVGSELNLFDYDTLIRHVELEADEALFVYDTAVYEQVLSDACEHGFRSERVAASRYWDSGVPIMEWLERFASVPERVASAEVLVHPRHVRRVLIEATGLVEEFDPAHSSLLASA